LIKGYFLKKLWNPLKEFLNQGLSPKKLAFTLALGIVLGLFPVVGTTTILCFIAAIVFRLNIGVIQLVNYFVYPLQLFIFIPTIQLGSYIFNLESIPDLDFFMANILLSLKIFWINVVSGIAIWFLLAIPVFFIVYYLAAKALGKEVI